MAKKPSTPDVEKEIAKLEASGRLTTDADGRRVVKLLEPVKANGQTYEVVRLRRGKTKDLVRIDEAKTDMAKAMRMVSCLSGMDERDLGEMEPEDFGTVSVVAASLMGKRQGTGGIS